MTTRLLPLAVSLFLAGGCQPAYDLYPMRVKVEEQRWQHHCIPAGATANLIDTMNQLGAKGWELAAATGSGADAIWCFKRPMPSP